MNRRTRALIGLTGLCVCATVSGSPAPAMAAGPSPATISARGHWTDATPFAVVSAQPLGANLMLTATGSSTWSGTLSGTTTFVLRALVEPDGQAVGAIEETFVGTVAGIGSGRLELTEAATQSPDGALRITAVATSGTGDLSRVGGLLRFVGSTDATGVGGGQYAGTLTD